MGTVIQPPSYYERLLILGRNGSGKSELTYAIEAGGNYRQSIYMDHKGDTEPRPPYKLIKRGDERLHDKRIVFRPEPGSYWRTDAGEAQFVNRLFLEARRAYDHKRKRSRAPRILIIPEILLFGPLAQKALGEVASAARQYELGLWVETQRPRRIPVVIRSEAWRLYIFALGFSDDEEEVLRYAKGRLSMADLRHGDDDPRDHSFFELLLRNQAGAGISVRRCDPLQLAA
jgi:hypothetical protein